MRAGGGGATHPTARPPPPPGACQIKTIIGGIPAGLATKDCCAQAQQFDTNKCACDNSLASLLSGLGIPISTPGLQGAIKITSTACGYQPVPCS